MIIIHKYGRSNISESLIDEFNVDYVTVWCSPSMITSSCWALGLLLVDLKIKLNFPP